MNCGAGYGHSGGRLVRTFGSACVRRLLREDAAVQEIDGLELLVGTSDGSSGSLCASRRRGRQRRVEGILALVLVRVLVCRGGCGCSDAGKACELVVEEEFARDGGQLFHEVVEDVRVEEVPLRRRPGRRALRIVEQPLGHLRVLAARLKADQIGGARRVLDAQRVWRELRLQVVRGARGARLVAAGDASVRVSSDASLQVRRATRFGWTRRRQLVGLRSRLRRMLAFAHWTLESQALDTNDADLTLESFDLCEQRAVRLRASKQFLGHLLEKTNTHMESFFFNISMINCTAY